jgi:hypothetical protein
LLDCHNILLKRNEGRSILDSFWATWQISIKNDNTLS